MPVVWAFSPAREKVPEGRMRGGVSHHRSCVAYSAREAFSTSRTQ
jgi:hypothetical protein